MKHLEGGWPAAVEPTEPGDIRKEKKKRERDTLWADAQIKLFGNAADFMRENYEIDLFEEYFMGEVPDQSTETLHTKTLSLFKQIY